MKPTSYFLVFLATLLFQSVLSTSVVACSCSNIEKIPFDVSTATFDNLLAIEVDSIVEYYMYATVLDKIYSEPLTLENDRIIIQGGWQGSGGAGCLEELSQFSSGDQLIVDVGSGYDGIFSLRGVCSTHFQYLYEPVSSDYYPFFKKDLLAEVIWPDDCFNKQDSISLAWKQLPNFLDTLQDCTQEVHWEAQMKDTLLEESFTWRGILFREDIVTGHTSIEHYRSNHIQETLQAGYTYSTAFFLGYEPKGFVRSPSITLQKCENGKTTITTTPPLDAPPIKQFYKGGTIKALGGGSMEVQVQINEKEIWSSQSTGKYSFYGESCRSYKVTPHENSNPLEGVSIDDIVLMRQHILGTNPFQYLEPYIAADINQSGTITTSDMVELQKLILHKIQQFEHNTSWRFITEDNYEYLFFNTGEDHNPLGEEILSSYHVFGDYNGKLDFTGIKIGNVSGDKLRLQAPIASQPRHTTPPLLLTFQDQYIRSGTVITLPIGLANNETIEGLQLALTFTGLEVVNMEEGSLTGSDYHLLSPNQLLLAGVGKLTNTQPLLSLQLVATTSGYLKDLLTINEDKLSPFAIEEAGQHRTIKLAFTNARFSATVFPNPFKDHTNISFNLTKRSPVRLRVFDAQGAVVLERVGDGTVGYNAWALSDVSFPKDQILFFQVVSDEGRFSGKLFQSGF